MARQRTIIGIGESLLAELPGESAGVPAGLAINVALSAAAQGLRGLPISRLGQDLLANELLTQLSAVENLDVAHLQSDPDLPTGRLVVRAIAGVRKEMLDQRAAFDNLQWDFDLVDVAKEADAVVFGMLAQRGGQTRSVVMRFLSEATGAIVACDLSNRAGESFERAAAIKSLEMAHIAAVDSTAWSVLRMGSQDTPPESAAEVLRREFDLASVVWMRTNEPMTVFGHDASASTQSPIEREKRSHALVALLCALLNGEETAKAVESVERLVQRRAPSEQAE